MAASDFEEQFIGHSGHAMSMGGAGQQWQNSWGRSPRLNSWIGTQAIYDFWLHLPKTGPVNIVSPQLIPPRCFAVLTTHVHRYNLVISGIWQPWMHELWKCEKVYFWSREVDPGYWHFERPASNIDYRDGEELSAKLWLIRAREQPRLDIDIDKQMDAMGWKFSIPERMRKQAEQDADKNLMIDHDDLKEEMKSW